MRALSLHRVRWPPLQRVSRHADLIVGMARLENSLIDVQAAIPNQELGPPSKCVNDDDAVHRRAKSPPPLQAGKV